MKKKTNRTAPVLCEYRCHGGKIDKSRCYCCHAPITEIKENTAGFYMPLLNVFLPLCDECRKKFNY
jgi:hypothetical protein